MRHGSDIIQCNARSPFFQSQFVSGFPSTVKLLPVKPWIHFRIFDARLLNRWGNREISNTVSVSRLAFQCATLEFNYMTETNNPVIFRPE